jgi:hypothetical protein
MRVEPLSESPELLPFRVPLLLVKSTELVAKAAIGSARASKASKNSRFILPPEKTSFFRFLGLRNIRWDAEWSYSER